MSELQDPSNLVWIDLETTGLDPETCAILEIATIVTDKDLNVIAQGPNLVIHQPEHVLAGLDDWGKRQHEASGLLAEVRRSRVALTEAEEATLASVAAHCPPGACPLAGSSVCFDRRFLIKHMPRLNAYLNYRQVDVSTVKELVKRWYPDKAIPEGKASRHRALADILDSIEELRYYRAVVFRPNV